MDLATTRLAWLWGHGDSGDGLDYDNLNVYPQAARKDLLRGIPIRTTGADVIFLLPAKKGATCQVLHAHPEGYWLLGDTVPAFLRAELATSKVG